MNQAVSPFKFLDSYQQADADIFFGREEETKALYKALSGVKHLLVYGPSGSGKTSLVECGLRNQFSDADWFALTIRRGSNINSSVFTSINNELDVKIKIDLLTKMPVDEQMEFGSAVEKLFAKRFQPIYLLFDQFEELLISGDDEEKKTFFTGLNNLINYKTPCRIMLIMREEFIGHLSEFEQLCPSIFQHRFRVEKMGRKNVEDVICHILDAPKYKQYFNVRDSHKLAECILLKLPDKRKEIELAHVQVFLGELWDRGQATKKNSELPLMSEDLTRDDDNLATVLESFLKNQIEELEKDYGKGIPLELLAAMISERFTKLQLSESAIKADLEHKKVVSEKPINHLLKQLEQNRIVRTIKVGDETQYEISHDVLALVVGQNLTEEMKIREKADDLYKVYHERPGLLTLDDVDYLGSFQKYLSYPTELQKKIDESIAAIKNFPVMEKLLKEQVIELEKDYGKGVPMELLAAMISERFTRFQLSEAAIKDDLENKKVVCKKPLRDLLKELEQRGIIRTIKVDDEMQYEIGHDVLAKVVGQNLTEEMKMREKAGDIYKVYAERKGLFTQDDIDYLRPFQESLPYPSELEFRIRESIAAIKSVRERELAETRKRLRTVYSLLGGALIALIAAGYFGFNANNQTKKAEIQKMVAEIQKIKADSLLVVADFSRKKTEEQLKLMQNAQDSLSVVIADLPIKYSAIIYKLGLIQQHLQKGTDFKSKKAAEWGIKLRTEFGNRLNGLNNQFLDTNEAICSNNGYYFLIYKADGNLVIRERLEKGYAERWSTKTSGNPAYRAIMQDDGNFVVYSNKNLNVSAIWATKTRSNPQTYLELKENGNLIIYNANKILWQSYSIDVK